MSLLLAVLCSVSGLQDASAEELARQLAEDSLERRAEATRRLRALGKDAREALEKTVRSGDAEAAGRARGVLQSIAQDLAIVAARGKPSRITIRLGERPFREGLAAVDRAAGFQTPVANDVENCAVSIDVTDVSYLEALDRLCEAHGNASLGAQNAAGAFRGQAEGPDARLIPAIRAGPCVRKPTRYDGSVRIRVESIRTDSATGVSVDVSTLWQPDMKPFNGPYLLIDAAEDDAGKSLLKKSMKGHSGTLRESSGEPYRWLHVSNPFYGEGATTSAQRIARLSGSILFRTVMDETRLDLQVSQDGKTYDLHPFEITLTRFRAAPGRADAVMAIRRKDKQPVASESVQPVDIRQVELLDADDRPFKWSGGGGGTHARDYVEAEHHWIVPEGRTPVRIRLRVAGTRIPFEHSFEFKDLPIPW